MTTSVKPTTFARTDIEASRRLVIPERSGTFQVDQDRITAIVVGQGQCLRITRALSAWQDVNYQK
jgi:hypothetical protein